ncbi:MAG: hypothetical protein AVDCRST_MAG25-337 [uncultured Rubrobacteraceae bacterium]|uniref:Response regulatory domain-containing protein n=1 Tax=uncultured Rubrobacteraceae bacterium TaxID=349277 RepID=A0A6J4R213_9ACTN|nr:MAG: hypothetical protein AVDCRST_MAG25-337 [uncultured Rubrobacteraceae bacterium]
MLTLKAARKRARQRRKAQMAAIAESDTQGRPTAKRPRILISVEPRAYRETIGDALQILRPCVEVTVVEPVDLLGEISRLEPALVICSVPETTEAGYGRFGWVEYRPYERPEARIILEGRCSEVEAVELADLLSVVDYCTAVAKTPR